MEYLCVKKEERHRTIATECSGNDGYHIAMKLAIYRGIASHLGTTGIPAYVKAAASGTIDPERLRGLVRFRYHLWQIGQLGQVVSPGFKMHIANMATDLLVMHQTIGRTLEWCGLEALFFTLCDASVDLSVRELCVAEIEKEIGENMLRKEHFA